MIHPEPVSAFAILKADGTIYVDGAGRPTLWIDTDPDYLSKGEVYLPVLIVDDSPLARAVREAEQRVLHTAVVAEREETEDGGCDCNICNAVRALLAARAERDGEKVG